MRINVQDLHRQGGDMCIMSSSLHGRGSYQVCRQFCKYMRKTRAVDVLIVKIVTTTSQPDTLALIALSRPPKWEYIDTTLSVLLSNLQAYS